jgi:predicted nucleic-acid-binding Zn-ribbon protein
MACAKCGSEEMIDAIAVDRGHSNARNVLEVEIQKRPAAWVFKDRVASPLRARVCGDCGYTELYATDVAPLLRAYKKTKQ